MKILALETSGMSGEVALLDDYHLIASEPVPPRTSTTMAPAIQRLLSRTGIQAIDLGLVAVTIGPGSFTGLRVGVVTANTLAYAIRCNLAGVDTLDAIASQAGRDGWAYLNAYRGEVFAAQYQAGQRVSPLTMSKLEEISPAFTAIPSAFTVGKLGLAMHLAGAKSDLLAPNYGRVSAAEEKLK